MASKEPLLIICKETKIHKPKPKRINKKVNNFQYNRKNIYNNRHSKPRNSRMNNHEYKKGNNIKNYLYEEKRKKLSFNLDMISLEEIENDFKEFKSKSEDIEVQKELLNLIRRAEHESFRNDCERIKWPQNPFCRNIE